MEELDLGPKPEPPPEEEAEQQAPEAPEEAQPQPDALKLDEDDEEARPSRPSHAVESVRLCMTGCILVRSGHLRPLQ